MLGIVLTVIGLSILISRKGVMATLEEATNNRGFLWFYGLFALMLGAVIIALNNVWSSGGLQLTVTIIGWLALLKGVYILIFPNFAASLYRKCNKSSIMLLAGFVVLIVGVILLFVAF